MKTYEFDQTNESLNTEMNKSRKFSTTVLIISIVLLILIILGSIWIFRSFKNSLETAYIAGDAAIQNARNSSNSNNFNIPTNPRRNNQNPHGHFGLPNQGL